MHSGPYTDSLTFLGIGAQKSGTTWLYKMLRQHPEIYMPDKKELHFWDTGTLTHENIVEYATQFHTPAATARGEITPAYAPLDLQTISLIKDYFPYIKLLYILRNPIERAWSHAKMHVLQYMEKGLKVDGHLVDMESMPDHWFVEHFHSMKSVRRGDYETCIRNWRHIYPDDRLHLMFYEDITVRPRELLEGCCAHLGIGIKHYADVDKAILKSRHKVSTPDTIRPSLLPVLEMIYHPKIEALSEYLGLDLYARWLAN